MLYKNFDIKTDRKWYTNPNPPLSKYIIFEVIKGDKKSLFIFNHNILNAMAEKADGVKLTSDKLEVQALEEITKLIDAVGKLSEKHYYFELFSKDFHKVNTIPEWCQNITI